MHRAQVLSVTRRVLQCRESDTLETSAAARIEPSACFTDPERFRADRALMARVPHVVGWAGEVGHPGDYTTKNVAGISVLIVRGEDSRIRAFVNACAHRGSEVVTGCGHAERFTCPYHAWSYRTDGLLAGVPSRGMFADVHLDGGLCPLPISERGGLLAVGLRADVDPESLLDDVTDELAGFDFARYAHIETRSFGVAANWKLTVDVNFEGYHFPILHRESLHYIATNHSAFDTFGRHCRWVFPFRDIDSLRNAPEEDWPERFHGTVVYGLFPSCVLIESPTAAQMLRVYPGRTVGESTVHLTAASLTPPASEAERQAHVAGLDVAYSLLRNEDFTAAESCQRGIASGVERVVFGRNEPLLQHLHEVWQRALEESGRSRD